MAPEWRLGALDPLAAQAPTPSSLGLRGRKPEAGPLAEGRRRVTVSTRQLQRSRYAKAGEIVHYSDRNSRAFFFLSHGGDLLTACSVLRDALRLPPRGVGSRRRDRLATSSGRRRGGSSRGAPSDGRSSCTSSACTAARRARCAVASPALLDHVWPLLGRGLNPSAVVRLAEGERIEPPRGLRLACFRDRCRRQP
jgi:hypothetical protein